MSTSDWLLRLCYIFLELIWFRLFKVPLCDGFDTVHIIPSEKEKADYSGRHIYNGMTYI